MKQKSYFLTLYPKKFQLYKEVSYYNTILLLIILLLIIIAIVIYKSKLYETMTINIYTDKDSYKLIEEEEEEEDDSNVVPYNSVNSVAEYSNESTQASTYQATTSAETTSQTTTTVETTTGSNTENSNNTNSIDNSIIARTQTFSDKFIQPLKHE